MCTRVCARARTRARAHTHTHTHTMQQKKAQLKRANGGPKQQKTKKKKQANKRSCRAHEPTAERRRRLPGGSLKAYVQGLLLLSSCVTPNVGLAPAVRAGPTCCVTSVLPSLSHASQHQALEASFPPFVAS